MTNIYDAVALSLDVDSINKLFCQFCNIRNFYLVSSFFLEFLPYFCRLFIYLFIYKTVLLYRIIVKLN